MRFILARISSRRTAEDLRPCKAGRFAPPFFGGNLGGFRLGTAVDDFPFTVDGLLGGMEDFRDWGDDVFPPLSPFGDNLGGFFLGPIDEDLARTAGGRAA